MLKKILALALVLMAAYIVLPFGFGLWNERLNVSAQISFAEPSAEMPEECTEGESPDAAPPEHSDTDEASDSAPIESELPAETQAPAPVELVPSAVPLVPDPVELVPSAVPLVPDPVELVPPAETLVPDPAPSPAEDAAATTDLPALEPIPAPGS